MKYKTIVSGGIIVFLLLFLTNFVFAAHYIVGYVEDAKDGTSANGRTVVLWKESVGMQDNVTDIVGATGNSWTDNYYLIDCEMLSSGCSTIGEELKLTLVDDGTGHIAKNNITVIVSGNTDWANNLTINSPPNATPSYPSQNSKLNTRTIDFICNFSDSDGDLQTAKLYGNWSGQWEVKSTKQISGTSNSTHFQLDISDGTYTYGCEVFDSSGINRFSQNNSFSLDATMPDITDINLNSNYSCGTNEIIRVGCNVSDAMSSFSTYIIAENLLWSRNYTTTLLSGNFYYTDILLNETGDWNFSCYAIDSYNNSNTLNYSDSYKVYISSYVDLYLNLSEISLNISDPIENQPNYIQAKVYSFGCANIENIKVGFYANDPTIGGENLWNDTINLQNNTFNISLAPWISKIGTNNLFVIIDPDNYISETNKDNNEANSTFCVNSWQNFYGNLSIDILLGKEASINMSTWFDTKNIAGNVFIADKESQINWATLAAIGKTKTETDSSKDFEEMDSVLGMDSFNDSMTSMFTNLGTPKQTETFKVQGRNITNVPVINSSTSTIFTTGILWDYSSSTNEEYDSSDKETLIFVSKVRQATEGKYGVYDYELNIPAKLREYEGPDIGEVYLYYEIN